MIVAVADMDIFQTITPTRIRSLERYLLLSPPPKWIVFDGNIPSESMLELTQLAHKYQIPVWFEPTSISKSIKVMKKSGGEGEEGMIPLKQLTAISPNRYELISMVRVIDPSVDVEDANKGNQSIHPSIHHATIYPIYLISFYLCFCSYFGFL